MSLPLAPLLALCLLLLGADAGVDELLQQITRSRPGLKAGDPAVRDEATQALIEAVDLLTRDFELFEEAEQRKVVKGVSALLSFRSPDDADRRVNAAAIAALSDMGEDGEKALLGATRIKHLWRDVELRNLIVQALGTHRNPQNVDFFFGLLAEDDPTVVRAAASALAEYHAAEGPLRKRIFERLLAVLGKAERMNAKHEGEDPEWHHFLMIVEVPLLHALDRMTGQTFQTLEEWEAWYREHAEEEW